MTDRNALPYRPCVGIVLIGPDRRVLAARRTDTPDAWQMPQGGIDPGEDPQDAARRELAEETGVTSIRYLGETEGWLHYDLPESLLGKAWGGRYRGQAQKWFAFAFTGSEAEIVLDGTHGEFDAWRWADPDELVANIVAFKRDIYRSVIKSFRPFLQ